MFKSKCDSGEAEQGVSLKGMRGGRARERHKELRRPVSKNA